MPMEIVFYQSEPILVFDLAALHMTKHPSLQHYCIKLIFVPQLKSDQHQRQLLRSAVTMHTQLNLLITVRKIIVFGFVKLQSASNQRTNVRLIDSSFVCLAKIQFFSALKFTSFYVWVGVLCQPVRTLTIEMLVQHFFYIYFQIKFYRFIMINIDLIN